jgi:hypothetical protein
MPRHFKIPAELRAQMEAIGQRSDEAAGVAQAVGMDAGQASAGEQAIGADAPAGEGGLSAVPPDAQPAPAPAPAMAEAQAAVETVTPAVPAPRPRKPSGEPSDNDLAEWTARVAAMQQEREQARREIAERQARKREQAAAWRMLRRLVEEAERPPEVESDPVAADPLARRVHQAPRKLRAVIDAVLTAHGR